MKTTHHPDCPMNKPEPICNCSAGRKSPVYLWGTSIDGSTKSKCGRHQIMKYGYRKFYLYTDGKLIRTFTTQIAAKKYTKVN